MDTPDLHIINFLRIIERTYQSGKLYFFLDDSVYSLGRLSPGILQGVYNHNISE
jgi:hypothetical protein